MAIMKFALWLQVNEGRTRRYYCNEINGNIHAPIQLHLLHMCQRICSVTPDRNAKTALKFSKKVFLRIVLTMRDFVGWLSAGVHICRGKCYTYTYMYTHIHTLISLSLLVLLILPLLWLPMPNYYKTHKLCAIIVNIADLMLKRFWKSVYQRCRWGEVAGIHMYTTSSADFIAKVLQSYHVH